ncbi:hypothetical protein LCGC14_1390930 [marine sediment metagenome]|uniref:Uncharacterized protein n=1 Tax=marine sediment metagenome TaxID=412755 RepID=A0A0F9MFL9_9ZZZZ
MKTRKQEIKEIREKHQGNIAVLQHYIDGTLPVVKTRIKHLVDWNEYVVEVFIDGILNEEKSYHTDDKQDAKDTQKVMELEVIEYPERYRNEVSK